MKETKLGLFKPDVIAAGIVWFAIIIMISPFFGREYIKTSDYVDVGTYEDLQYHCEYLEEEIECLEEKIKYYEMRIDECNLDIYF